MSTPAITPDASQQFQYIKLPDGSYGKFRADASDDVIKQAIAKDFPSAFGGTNAVISNQPKPGSMAWFKSMLYRGTDATANALPGAGAMIGAYVGAGGGSVVPGPGTALGAIGGAGIGGMGGEAAKHLVRQAAGFEQPYDPGQAAGDVAKQGALQGGIQGLTEALPFLAPLLRRTAVSQYTKALAPTTKINKAIAEDIAPQMIQRGQWGSLEGLEKNATQQASTIRPELNAEYASLQQAQPQIKGAGDQVVNDLEGLKNSYVVDGKIADPQAVNAISDVQDIVRQYGSDVSPDSLRRLRQIFENPVAKKGGYAGADLSTQYALQAKDAASNSIRRILNTSPTDIGALNKEISFWLDVQRVTGDSALRQTGQQGGMLKVLSPLAAGLGGTTGFIHGGAQQGLEGFLGTAGMIALTRALRSPAWRTLSAVGKARLADALASGSAGNVASTLTRLGFAVNDTMNDAQ